MEKGATPLRDGSALLERRAGDDWVVGEILANRGNAVLLEPDDLRRRIAERAKVLAEELGVSRLRARRGARA